MGNANESTMIAIGLAAVALVTAVIGAPWLFPVALSGFALLFGVQGLGRRKTRATIARANEVGASAPHAASVIPGVAEILDFEGLSAMPRPVVDDSASILWRGAVGPTGWRAHMGPDADDLTTVHREVSPVDVLVVTSTGLHLINVVEPSQPWNRKYVAKMSDSEVDDLFEQSFACAGLLGQAEKVFDRVVNEHGYKAVAESDPRNLIIGISDIRRAWVKRPFRLLIDLGMPKLYIEALDETVTRWELKDGRPKRLDELDQALAEIDLGNSDL